MRKSVQREADRDGEEDEPGGRTPLRTAEMGGVTGAPAPAGLGGSLGSGPTSVSSAMPPGSPFGVPSGRLADAFVPGTPRTYGLRVRLDW